MNTDLMEGLGETRLEIHRGWRHLVERVTRSDGSSTILKTRRPDAPPIQGTDPLRAEHACLQFLADHSVRHVARPLALLESAGGVTLMLSDAGPRTLDDWLRRRPLPIGRFLDLAIQLAETLGSVHRHGVVHCDISPTNLVVSAEADWVTLIDFDAARTPFGQVEDVSIPALADAPLFVAPELTGRLESRFDQRADLYSLGATLYH